jgi:hypothetical protein
MNKEKMMKKFLGTIAVITILIGGTMTASAQHGGWGHGGGGGGWHGGAGGGWHGGGGGGWHGGGGFGGLGGFAAGAVLGGLLGSQSRPYYQESYGYGGDGVSYCMQRFRSYDPYSRTYVGYDGYRHSCP